MLGHESNILQDLLTNIAHIVATEAQEFIILRDCLQIDILKTVFHCEWLVNLAIDYAAFEIKLTELLLDLEEEVAHEQDVHFLNVLHLDGVDTVDLGDETLRVALQVI